MAANQEVGIFHGPEQNDAPQRGTGASTANQQPNPAPMGLVAQAEQYGAGKVAKSATALTGLGVFAGIFISIAFVFYLTVTTGAGAAPWGLVRLVGGIAFSLGLILVVVSGGELFTSSVLTSVAWAAKRINTAQMLTCWGRVFGGNALGAGFMVALVMGAGLYQLDGGQWGLGALKLAQHKLHHSWSQAFCLGVLCNMLVCLGVWMTFACRDTLSKALLLVLPVAMFVSSGFEHSIANLFMVPLGIAIHSFAGSEFFSVIGVDPATFADLTLSNFILHNLIPVTLGNIVGGALVVGLGYWWIEQNTDH
ncbi:formate transporter FocA [Shewanella cyperi]|uniref:formate transporter FocA n=1 Tax=Shewanella cyperi TaxID=2814292 RepID=UPI001D182DDF|nr:formate transporter FocA [Shewanella cyperi]